MAQFKDPVDELAPRVKFLTDSDADIDVAGLDNVKVRLQLGCADELTLVLPAQDVDGKWRSDMPVFNAGAVIQVHAGHNGEYDLLQKFEVVSTTTDYDRAGSETATVRGVSDLARAARSKKPRAFDAAPGKYSPFVPGADKTVLDAICQEFGWRNATGSAFADPAKRTKENGKSDLDLLKKIALDAEKGGPRLTREGDLIMPDPVVGLLKYARGLPSSATVTAGWRRLHQLQVNREAGPCATRVAIVGWDPELKEFVETEFEADEFGGDPKITYEGPVAHEELAQDATTQGLILAAIEHQGYKKEDRIDILARGRYTNATDAADLARRWFLLREKLSRWAEITVDGHIDLLPYESIEIDGTMAAMDKGVWLPMTIEHEFSAKGWSAKCRCIRVVENPVIKPVPSGVEFAGFGSGPAAITVTIPPRPE